MKKKKHVISSVLPGGIGEELELEPGDVLAEINHQPVEDVFDYRYLLNDEYIELLIEKANGEFWELEVEKDYDEDLGIESERYRPCDQIPSFTDQCILSGDEPEASVQNAAQPFCRRCIKKSGSAL